MSDFVHRIKITELTKKATYNGVSDVICHARWLLETWHKDYPSKIEPFQGATPLRVSASSLQQENFTPLTEVTEEMAIEWVYANAKNIGLLKYNNEKKLKEKLFSNTSLVNLPWI